MLRISRSRCIFSPKDPIVAFLEYLMFVEKRWK
jgi:hypothetical protein